jgi:choline dehydrogenase-like flavoprotein
MREATFVNDSTSKTEYDVIVVGSGTSGATLARELSKRKKKVLLLERAANTTVKETVFGILAVAKEVALGDQLKALTVHAVGGCSTLYFAKCIPPTSATFSKLGIDLAREFDEVRKEVPMAELPDAFLTPQAVLVRDSARQLGYGIKKRLMLIDQSKCSDAQYSYEAKWKPRSYIDEGVGNGVQLTTGALVRSVIVENGRAVGVEYTSKNGSMGSKLCKAYGKDVVLCAGSLATPKLLIDCGVDNVGDGGFFCHAAFMLCGTVPGLKGRAGYVGQIDLQIDELAPDVLMGETTMHPALFKLIMLGNKQWRRIFAHPRTLSLGISIEDSPGGSIDREGRYHKQLKVEELAKLDQAAAIGIKILKNAGARDLFRTQLAGGIPGGVLRIGEHLDENLQTRIRNLYVCDHSLIPDPKVTPTVTLMCLARYLAKRLADAQERIQPQLRAVAV